jgi:protein AbiQ
VFRCPIKGELYIKATITVAFFIITVYIPSMVNTELNFYYIDTNYADFLRDEKFGDTHIPYTVYPNGEKFFIGVVLNINNINYFAPVTSNKGVNPAAFNILEADGRIISSVRTNYMFPVVDGVYKRIDIPHIENRAYRYLVEKEYRFCNLHREEIRELAEKIYLMRMSGQVIFKDPNDKKNNQYINNFKKLERRAKQYIVDETNKFVKTSLHDPDAELSAEEKALVEKHKITKEKMLEIRKKQEKFFKREGEKYTLESLCRASKNIPNPLKEQTKTQEKIVTKTAVQEQQNKPKKRPVNYK